MLCYVILENKKKKEKERSGGCKLHLHLKNYI